MKNKFQSNFNGVRMGGGSIEHPLSIHSASIGTRWKPRGLQFLMTLVLLFTMGIGQMWGADPTSTYDVSDLITAGTITSSTTNDDLDQTIDNVVYDWNKGGSSSNVRISSQRVQLFGDGQSLTISTSSDYRIKSIRFAVGNKSNSPTAIVESSSAGSWNPAFTTSAFGTGNYTFTVTTPTAGGSYTFTIYKSGGTNQRADFDDIVVTYDAAPVANPTVVYYPNGATSGTVPVDANSPYASGDDVTVLGNSGNLDKTAMEFVGWNTKADGSGTSYQAGNVISDVTTNIKLYAQWAYPATGTGTIIYALTYDKNEVTPSISGVTTLSSSSTAFALSSLTIGVNSDKKSGYSAKIENAYLNDESRNVALQFTVADGYTFTPTDVSMTIFANSTSYMKAKVVLSDGTTTVESEELSCSSSADSEVEFASGAFTGKKFTGNVNVVVYLWLTSGSGKRAYIKSPVTITGTVAAAGYSVTYVENGHGANQTDLTGLTALPDPLPTLSETGWTFGGWFTDDGTFENEAEAGDPISANTTLYAKWTANASSCAATIPGNITKGTASDGTGTITLTADGSAADGDTWYWQSSADGEDKTGTSGKTKDVSAAGTYYIRSYNTAGDCWSSAKSVTVAAEDLLTAITPNLSYDANVIVGNTLSPTLTGNAGNGTVVYTLNDVTPAGSLTINESTGVVTAVTAGGTATVTATIAANGNYAGNTATSGTITAFANPLGTHTITYTLSPINTSDASLTSTQVSTSTYLKNLTTIDASSCGFASSPSAGKNRTAKINRASSGKDNNKFVYLTFNVESGYQFTPTSIVVKVANVSNVTTFDAALISSDGPSVGEEEKSFSSTDGSVETWTIANEAETALTGTVTLKIWPYANSAGSFRFGTPITITGTVAAEETKYDLSFAAGTGASGEMSTLKYAEGAEVTLPACTFTAPDSKEFDAWTSTDVTIENNKFTMPEKNVTITATWKAVTPKYHVTYNGNNKTSGNVPTDATNYESGDEVTVLGKGDLARIIDGNAATFYGWNTKDDMTGTHYDAGANFNIQEADVTLYAEWGYSIEYTLNGGSWKSGYTAPDHYLYGKGVTLPTAENVERVGFEFDAWYSEWHVINEGGYIDDNKRTEVTSENYGNARYLATWTALPLGNAQSVDLEGLVEDEGTGANWQAYMTSHGYEYSTESVSLDAKTDPSAGKAYDNWPYQGLKMKNNGAYVQGTVEADKLVIIKLGHMAAAANVTIGGVAAGTATGLDAAEPAGKLNYFYVENEAVLRLTSTNDGACVLKAITITNPYQVSFNANGGTPIASQYGHPSVTLPSATNGSQIFLGWFTEETGGTKIGEANESYTPSADITLYAHWEAVSSDARLASISFSAAGTLSPEFNPEETVYTYTMPYGTAAIPQITGATSVNANAQAPIIGDAATAWGEAQTIKGVAESGDKKTYTITMLQAPKDGVAIISIDVPTGNGNVQTIAADNISGFIGGTATQKLQSGSKKLGGNGNYIGFTLANSEELKAGDVIRLNVSATNGASHLTLYQDGSDANLVKDIEWPATTGVNLIPIPSEAVGLGTLYIYRKSSECNPTLAEFAILRPMNPILTAITIDGRDGVIDEANKTVEVTIPFESDLDNLTVVPEVVWNAEHATTPTTVISHEGAWVLAADGDNTYRVMDKDGDYTDYTITLTRDIKKYTVTFNAQGGSTVQSELVVAGEKLAAAPADPTREDYLFLGWAEAAEGEVVDVTDFVINTDKTFFAQWQDEHPIKLIQADTINTKDFITGVSINTVQIGDVTHKCFEFAGGLSSFINIKDKNRVVVYNARTNKTKIKVSMYNDKSSALTYYIKGVVEGSTTVVDLAEVVVESGETKTTEYYEFNNADAKNRSIYVYVETSASNMHFLQVKVIESGDEPVKKLGEIGYSINLHQGRLFGRGGIATDFEGIHYDMSSDYQPTSSASCKLANKAISFKLESPMTLTVTTNTNKTYYVATTADGTTNETSTSGEHEFQLTPGTWYIIAGSSNVEFTNLAFSAAKPVYTRENLNPANIGTLCVKYNGRLEGATLYELNGKNEYNKLVFDEVENNVMVAGRPYIFVPENGNTKIEVYKSNEEFAEEAGSFHGMQGTFVALSTITDGMNSPLWGNYIISNNKYIYVDADNCSLKENRAYILSLDQVPDETPAEPNTNGSPRRRVVMGGNPAPSVVTGFDNLNEAEAPMKVMIDGQMFIIRGEKMFDATGRLVK